MLARFRQGEKIPDKPVAAPEGERAVLSMREHEVLVRITKGFTFEEIAHLLGVSRHTVQTYVRRIYAKLEVGTKVEAIFEARRQGLLAD